MLFPFVASADTRLQKTSFRLRPSDIVGVFAFLHLGSARQRPRPRGQMGVGRGPTSSAAEAFPLCLSFAFPVRESGRRLFKSLSGAPDGRGFGTCCGVAVKRGICAHFDAN
jgi:hypothetical protein